jgi:hypothetical protein
MPIVMPKKWLDQANENYRGHSDDNSNNRYHNLLTDKCLSSYRACVLAKTKKVTKQINQ